uniref:Integrase catalytic domain-containing protein n=1 Tax=Fagus sylvatica TaxID=28930 RepID=A0A2N9GI24_FAGSY
MYDGRADPIGYISHYRQSMALHLGNDALICRMFPSSLGPMSLRWFNRLQHSSIHSWDELAEAFVSRFITNSRKSKESLRSYSSRYWEVNNEVDSCTEEIAIKTFKLGLDPESELRHNLSRRPAKRYLRRYIGDGQKQHYHEGQTVAHNTKPTVRVIEMIHTSRPNEQSYNRLRSDLKKAQHLREVFQVAKGSVISKKQRTDFPNSEQQIFFSNEDLRDVQTPHNDPLLVKLRIGDSDVKQGIIRLLYQPKITKRPPLSLPLGVYCYKVMSFGLKNASATYQRMVTKMFKDQIGRTMEIYIDDMVVKRKLSQNHLEDLTKTFRTLRLHKLCLNASKCVFGVGSGKFLGFMVSHRGPTEPLFLYLAVSERAVSAVLIRIKDIAQCPIYSTSKTMTDAETRYLPLEKVSLALVTTAKKLPQYFQAHTIYVVTQYPVQAMFQKSDFTGRISKWGTKIGALDVKYLPRTAIKGQILADFVAEFTPALGHEESSATAFQQDSLESLGWWKVYVDGASNTKGSGTGVVIITPDDTVIEQSIRLDFKASNNKAKYEAVLAGLNSAITHFNTVRVEQIGQNLNSHANALATLAFVLSADFKRFIPIKTLATPRIDLTSCHIHTITVGQCWMDPYVLYLKEGILPEQRKEAEVIRRKALASELQPLVSPWPFAQWGMDLVGPLPRATRNRRWLIVVTDYFTKWVKAEPLANIRDKDSIKFVWKNIITRFGVPKTIISDNGMQFKSKSFMRYCSELGIRNVYSSPAYLQSNGQVEASNKTILDGIKKRLEDAKGKWVEELLNILWTFRTTPQRSTGETPFSLAYSSEAVIPLEIVLPTLRTSEWEPERNDLAQSQALDLLEERRE